MAKFGNPLLGLRFLCLVLGLALLLAGCMPDDGEDPNGPGDNTSAPVVQIIGPAVSGQVVEVVANSEIELRYTVTGLGQIRQIRIRTEPAERWAIDGQVVGGTMPFGHVVTVPINPNFPVGEYPLWVEATDQSGRVGRDFILLKVTEGRDILPPSITITQPIANQTFVAGDSIGVQGTVTDPAGVKYVYLALLTVAGTPIVEFFDSDVSGTHLSLNYQLHIPTATPPGTYRLQASSQDLNNNVATTEVAITVSE